MIGRRGDLYNQSQEQGIAPSQIAIEKIRKRKGKLFCTSSAKYKGLLLETTFSYPATAPPFFFSKNNELNCMGSIQHFTAVPVLGEQGERAMLPKLLKREFGLLISRSQNLNSPYASPTTHEIL